VLWYRSAGHFYPDDLEYVRNQLAEYAGKDDADVLFIAIH